MNMPLITSYHASKELMYIAITSLVLASCNINGNLTNLLKKQLVEIRNWQLKIIGRRGTFLVHSDDVSVIEPAILSNHSDMLDGIKLGSGLTESFYLGSLNSDKLSLIQSAI